MSDNYIPTTQTFCRIECISDSIEQLLRIIHADADTHDVPWNTVCFGQVQLPEMGQLGVWKRESKIGANARSFTYIQSIIESHGTLRPMEDDAQDVAVSTILATVSFIHANRGQHMEHWHIVSFTSETSNEKLWVGVMYQRAWINEAAHFEEVAFIFNDLEGIGHHSGTRFNGTPPNQAQLSAFVARQPCWMSTSSVPFSSSSVQKRASRLHFVLACIWLSPFSTAMAEALGAVASGIAVAQIAGTAGSAIWKLKQLWDEVEDVPEIINDLIEQLGCLDPSLWDAERQFSQQEIPALFWDQTAARRSTEYCRRALQKISDLTNDLSMLIDSKKGIRRKIGCMKVVLKKQQISSLEQRLGNAIRMLQVAQQGYIMAFMQIQPDIVAYKLANQFRNQTDGAQIALEKDQTAVTDDAITSADRSTIPQASVGGIRATTPTETTTEWRRLRNIGPLAIQSTTGGFKAGFRPPMWLAGLAYAWDLSVVKSYGGWKSHLQTYSIRPTDSEIFNIVKRGDINSLKRVFSMGEASPYDRDGLNGMTLLHYACVADLSTFKFILGLTTSFDPTEKDGHRQ
ncbi:hypothetical protein SUNI508_05324 [Seiridium unicorne]|uniref:Uncharacterized protein n=1 Tax=Seiridium unicorne TaxID=138068 RepID=A0ABR2V533_9PEZI